MHSQRMGVPQGSPSDKWLSAKRRKWIPFKPALTIYVGGLGFFATAHINSESGASQRLEE